MLLNLLVGFDLLTQSYDMTSFLLAAFAGEGGTLSHFSSCNLQYSFFCTIHKMHTRQA